MMANILLLVLLAPVLGSLIILFIPKNININDNEEEDKTINKIALNSSFISFVSCLFLCLFFKKSIGFFQFVTKIVWIASGDLHLNLTFGVDGISLLFVILTTLLVSICILNSWDNIVSNEKEFLILFLMLEFFLVGAFLSMDLLLFYIFFESVLIPMFLIIGVWGSRERKVLAVYYFFLYTLFGSLFMLLSILYIYCQVGTTDYETLLTFTFSEQEQKFLWITFFLAFASKVPMIPVHLWLPEAHVEAPTAGSVILAGVLLKLGTYGFIRFSLPLFPKACFFFAPLVYTIAVVGVIYTSFTAIRQSDFKRTIAYTSIAHMNLVILGIFSFNTIGIEGALLQSLSHGFVSSGLFLVVGIVYDRYKTRIIQYYGGLAITMPLFIIIFLFFTLANISFPGTSSFVGEFLVLAGSFQVSTGITFIGALGIIIGSAYSLWLFNRIAYGNIKTQYTFSFIDLNFREVVVFLPLILGTFFVGIYPNIFLSFMHASVNNIIELIQF